MLRILVMGERVLMVQPSSYTVKCYGKKASEQYSVKTIICISAGKAGT